MNIYIKENLKAIQQVQQIITELVIVENDILCNQKQNGEMMQVHTQKQKDLLVTLSNLQKIENEIIEITNMINE